MYAANAEDLSARDRRALRAAARARVWGCSVSIYRLPWLNWGGRQAVLFDLPARKFFIFGLSFWPQDFIFLALLLIIAALALFFFTAMAGACGAVTPVRRRCGPRPSCGWSAWPKAIATRARNSIAAPGRANKLMRKSGKHFCGSCSRCGPVSPSSASSRPFARSAGSRCRSLGPWETFWVLFYGFATYGNAGYLREQVCKYMCPYARFQSAMFDKDTLIITYDNERGEPRGARKRGTDPREQGLGDCIDCTWCVQVCPTGIDIRQGLQIECIACAACIDACDAVMDKVGYPRGLIRYSTEHALHHEPTRLLRPRMLIYGGLLCALVIGFVVAIAVRSPVSLDVLRDRNSLYRLTDDGNVDNVYTLRILNKTEREQRFRIEARGASALTLLPGDREYIVASGDVYSLPLRVRRAAYEPLGPETITLTVRSVDDPAISSTTDARFLAPAR